MAHPVYSTLNGIYKEGCGLDKLNFAWGHDEYMYRMLKANDCKLPKVGLDIIRLHSCYPLHRENEYQRFLTQEDRKTLEWVKRFNAFDLYTKDNDNVLELDKLWPYYKNLCDKYIGEGKLKW